MSSRRVSLTSLRRFVEEVFVALGASRVESETVADVLVAADRLGIDSHGVSRLGYYVERIRAGITRPGAPATVVRESPTTVVVDGGHGLGHVVARDAMRRAIEKARRVGLGAAAVRNSTHYGIAGYYALLASDAGMIGIATTNARPCLAPTNGTEPLYGTNPLAIAAPSDEPHPFLFDAALSIIQRGRVELHRRDGAPLPEGWAIDAAGEPAVDPATLLQAFMTGDAALLPLGGSGTSHGGHKGYGLAIGLEILNAALSGGAFLDGLGGNDRERVAGGATERRTYDTGHFFLALDANAFMGIDACRHRVGTITRRLRASRRRRADGPVLVAGDPEWAAAARRERDGVPIPDPLAEELEHLADALGVSHLDSL